MKLPREILLAKHRVAEAKLEEVTRRVVAGMEGEAKAGTGFIEWLGALPRSFWREVILPARRIWAGLAAVWVVIAVANLDFRASAPRMAAASSSAGAGYFARMREEEKWATAFTGAPEPMAAEPPKHRLPQPHAELRQVFFMI
jgi:hypothetical protein